MNLSTYHISRGLYVPAHLLVALRIVGEGPAHLVVHAITILALQGHLARTPHVVVTCVGWPRTMGKGCHTVIRIPES